MVWPTISGRIVERRDQVLITFFSLRWFSASTLTRRWSSMNGPFLSERGIGSLFLHPTLLDPLGAAHFAEPADRPHHTMRNGTERAYKARSLRVRNVVHDHGPAGFAQPKEHLRRRIIL